MCLGGGGSDDSAKIARQQEQERQRRIREGMSRVNQIFGGDITDFVKIDPTEALGPAPVAPTRESFAADRGRSGDVYALLRGGFAPSSNEDFMLAQERYEQDLRNYNMQKQMLLQQPDKFREISRGTAQGQFTDDFYNGLGKSFLDHYTPELNRQYEDARKQNIFRFANSGNLESGAANAKFGDIDETFNTQRVQLADRALGEQQRMRGEVEQNRAELIQQLEGGAGIESTAQSALARARSLSAPQQFSPLGDAFAQFTGMANASRQAQAQGYKGFGFTAPGGLLGSRGNSSVKTV